MLSAFTFSFVVKIVFDSVYTGFETNKDHGHMKDHFKESTFLVLETFYNIFAENFPIALIYYFHVRHFVRGDHENAGSTTEESENTIRNPLRRASSMDD